MEQNMNASSLDEISNILISKTHLHGLVSYNTMYNSTNINYFYEQESKKIYQKEM